MTYIDAKGGFTMPIEFFRNEMMNKLFIPMVATGTVAVTAVVVTTVNWSAIGDTKTGIENPNNPDDIPGTVDPEDEDEISMGVFDDTDYDDMGGIQYADDEDETTVDAVEMVKAATSSITRCYNPVMPGYFVELGFNDENEEFTYVMNPQFGENPLKFMSLYTYYDDPVGFLFIANSYKYMDITTEEVVWQNLMDADASIYGDNDGTVEWLEWKEYMLENSVKSTGFTVCEETIVEVETPTETDEDNDSLQVSGGIPTALVIVLSGITMLGAAGIVYKIKFM